MINSRYGGKQKLAGYSPLKTLSLNKFFNERVFNYGKL